MPGPLPTAPLPVGGDTQTSATASVQQGANLPSAQRVGGAIATATATPVGAAGATAGQNLAFSTVGSVATQAPEVSALSWLVTFGYQGIKRLPFVDQNRDQWWILPVLAFLVGLGIWFLTSQGDWLIALSKALSNTGLMAFNAAMNYQTAKPLHILTPATN